MTELAEDQEIAATETPAEKPRAVAVIGGIIGTDPIAGADRIHRLTVDCGDAGVWAGVAAKSMVDGLVLVLLQDALLPPDNDRWAFMASHHFRVRMARFKGCPSECVILPLEDGESGALGDDMGATLGITKYEKALPKEMAGIAKGNFPTFIPKTDEPNFQRVRDLADLMDGEWYATEKADGTSCTVYRGADNEMHVCSRNLDLEPGDNLYWRMAIKYGFENIPYDIAVQFEIVGPGVQGNPMDLEENEIRVFTAHLFDVGSEDRRATFDELTSVCANNQLPMARVIAFGSGPRTPDQLRKMAEIKYPNGKPGEGIVIRGVNSDFSFKVLSLLYKD
jgi:RNA ligase (TIGR02306 family)